jgi:hypothetical protein
MILSDGNIVETLMNFIARYIHVVVHDLIIGSS